jgi:Family of unknown function (DUF6492)
VSELTYALVTPSFSKDFERCALLVESVQKWVAPHVRHYLVIDRRDVPLFAPLASQRTKILVVEDIVPKWIVRVPGIRRFWLSFRTRPVKNWILQQMVKISIPEVVPDDILLYTDSDVFFVAPYDPRQYERSGLVPLFVEPGQRGKIPRNDEWHQLAARLLGVPAEASYDTNYVGNIVCWRRANAVAMLRRLEEVSGKHWARVVAPLSGFSEYILYGVYATQILNDSNSGHWYDGVIRTHNYWRTTPLDVAALEKFKGERTELHHSVMISAKSHTQVADIRQVFFPRA